MSDTRNPTQQNSSQLKFWEICSYLVFKSPPLLATTLTGVSLAIFIDTSKLGRAQGPKDFQAGRYSSPSKTTTSTQFLKLVFWYLYS